ncbi:MAG: hypothetical protein Q4C47_02315 [Planctomycetia bacterium]|nr:hypothetical protein [Planctomycetia bacterium]
MEGVSGLIFTLYLTGLVIELGRMYRLRGDDPGSTRNEDAAPPSSTSAFPLSGRRILVPCVSAALLLHTTLIVGKIMTCPDQSSLFAVRQHWFLIVSWTFAFMYYICLIRWSGKWFGLFLMMTTILLGIGIFLPPSQIASRPSTSRSLGLCHGLSLAVATLAIFSGSLAGMMDHAARHRIRRKIISGSAGYPSLEWLSRFGRRCLGLATIMTTFGLISGIGLIRHGAQTSLNGSVPGDTGALVWYDPIVLGCVVLTGWLIHCEIRLWRHPEYGESRRLFRMIHLSAILFLTMLVLLFHNATRHGGFGFHTTSRSWSDPSSGRRTVAPGIIVSDGGGVERKRTETEA